jgi:hypothetical protein
MCYAKDKVDECCSIRRENEHDFLISVRMRPLIHTTQCEQVNIVS